MVEFVSSHAGQLSAIALLGALVNGALGYGFSSITIPLALLFLSNRQLNPALVLIEAALNAYVLWVNRKALPAVGRRVTPIVFGLWPGVIAGTLVVSRVSPAWLKLTTYLVLLPPILAQAAGYRRPIRSERAAGLAFGTGLGTLYAVTTISGPPLAVALNNQGLAKGEFRAALGLVRLSESAFTAVAYLVAGLYSSDSLKLIPPILPSLALGVPLGTVLIRHVPPETFRRICMSFDAWIVSFGAATVSRELGLMTAGAAALVVAAIVALDGGLLYRYFARRVPAPDVGPSEGLT